MAVITQSIGTASRNFSTIQAWEDALPANLVTDGNSYVGECYNDSEFVTSGVAVTFAGCTCDASHTITLTCHAGQSFSDNANVQTNALRYNQANGVGIRGNTGGYNHVIVIGEDFVTIRGLQVKNDSVGFTGGAALHYTAAGLTHNDINQSILEGTRPGTTTGFGAIEMHGGTLRNCLVVARGTGRAFSAGYADAGLLLINNTFVKPSDGDGSNDAIQCASGTVTVKNCAAFGFTTFVNNSARFTGSNNCSDVAIGFGTSNQASKTYANQFQSTVDATRDFRLKSGSDCIDTGITDSTNAATDIAGTSRPSGSAYDIGAWEFVQASSILLTQIEHAAGRGAFRGYMRGLR